MLAHTQNRGLHVEGKQMWPKGNPGDLLASEIGGPLTAQHGDPWSVDLARALSSLFTLVLWVLGRSCRQGEVTEHQIRYCLGSVFRANRVSVGGS